MGGNGKAHEMAVRVSHVVDAFNVVCGGTDGKWLHRQCV
jgi:hypothetical protein